MNGSDITLTFQGREWHTGYTRLSMYMSCPKKYKYQYVNKEEGVRGMPLKRGSAYHRVLEVALTYKKDRGKELKISKIREFANYFADDEGLDERETRNVVAACEFWHATFYPKLEPLFVEQYFSIEREGVTYTGIIDLGCLSGRTVNHKMSFDLWDKARAKNSVQAMIYQWAWEDVFAKQYDVPYKDFAYEIVKTFPGVNGQQLVLGRVAPEGSQWYEDHLRDVAKAMCKGVYFAKPDYVGCGHCDFKALCNPVFYRVKDTKFGTFDPDEPGQ